MHRNFGAPKQRIWLVHNRTHWDQTGSTKFRRTYILRPSFAGIRLQYQADNETIECRTTKGMIRRMDALDWIALVTSHIPDRHQQMVRYYGRYSNASRGKRRTQTLPGHLSIEVDSPLQPDSPARHYARQRRRNWARLLKKVYEVDPLTCPRLPRLKSLGSSVPFGTPASAFDPPFRSFCRLTHWDNPAAARAVSFRLDSAPTAQPIRSLISFYSSFR